MTMFTKENLAEFTKENLPDRLVLKEHVLREPILAVRIQGSFQVKSASGIVTCNDGYLVKGFDGEIFPVEKDSFEAIYKEPDQE